MDFRYVDVRRVLEQLRTHALIVGKHFLFAHGEYGVAVLDVARRDKTLLHRHERLFDVQLQRGRQARGRAFGDSAIGS